jgi:ubiquinone/menaquinone biosynthesis C-methylase UbiE
VKGIVGSMDNLPFQSEELDLIWSEGAIYNIGFERGLNEWRRYLKPGGYIAVSESSWFTDERPAEINDFWVFCRRIAGQSITLLQRLKLRKSSFINMREIRLLKNSVRFSLMKKNCTASIKHSTVIHFSSQKR